MASRAKPKPADDPGMLAMDIHAYARQLLDARGVAAIAEAAQKARAFADQGDRTRAETWRRIQAALLVARGPGQS